MLSLSGLEQFPSFYSSLYYPLVVIFLAYIVRGIAGFASALTAVPFLALVLPLTLVVPLVVLLDYLSSASHGIGNRHNIVWWDIWPLIPFSVLGVGSSLIILESVSPNLLSLSLGAFVIIYAFYQLLPQKLVKANYWVAVPTGFMGGLIGTLFGTGGPFYVIYLHLRRLGKNEFRATFACIFLIDGLMRLSGFALNGLYDELAISYLVTSIPVAALGLYLGGRIHVAISKESFTRMISLLLLGSGSALIANNL